MKSNGPLPTCADERSSLMQPLPDLSAILVGSLMMVIGLSMFIQGLESQIETFKKAAGKT